MKKFGMRFLALCLMLCMLLGNACAATLDFTTFRERLAAAASKKSYEFVFHENDEGLTWAEWERKSKGVNFRVKVHNISEDEYVDAYTLEISAQNVYEEPILIKASDGDWYDELWYTGDNTYKPGRIAYTEYFFVEGDEKIKYITATLVKYHIKGGGTVEVAEEDRDTRTWTID